MALTSGRELGPMAQKSGTIFLAIKKNSTPMAMMVYSACLSTILSRDGVVFMAYGITIKIPFYGTKYLDFYHEN